MNRTSAFTFIFLLFAFVAVSQPVKRAEHKMNLYNYSKAISILSKAVDNPSQHDAAVPLLAECYRMQNDNYNAKAWYARAIELPGARPEWYLYYANALRTAGEYQKAKDIFIKYAELNPSDPRGKLFASYCDSVTGSWNSLKPGFEIKQVESLNSPQSDFGPAFLGNTLVFCSDRQTDLDEYNKGTYGWTGRGYLDILSASPLHTSDFWSGMNKPASFKGKFNQTYHDGPATFQEGKVVYFTRTINRKPGKTGDIRTNLLKIYYADYKDGKWGDMIPFSLNSNDYSIGHPALSQDGGTLCFASDMPGGQGGSDLWMCRKQGDQWSAPLNLGPGINTPGEESFPSIQSDGSLLYSSDRLPGYGGLDLFRAEPSDGTWINPENLGKPVNSSYDDFAMNYAPGRKNGFFSSNRPGGMGSDDIYAFNQLDKPEPPKPEPPKPVVIETPKPVFITGIVKDKKSLQPLEGATVFVYFPKEGKVRVVKSGADGMFRLEVKEPGDLSLKAMKPKYIADCETFPLAELKPGETYTAPRELLLDKLEVNKVFKIDNIYYDFDKFNIREDAKPELDKLVRIMKENPINVELGSHTDSRGSFVYNDRLSQNRAQSAVDYIVTQGISNSRITAKGYGEHQLVNKCADGVKCSDAEHQANRRTEFKVTGYTAPAAIVDQFNPDTYQDGEVVDIRNLPNGFYNPCK